MYMLETGWIQAKVACSSPVKTVAAIRLRLHGKADARDTERLLKGTFPARRKAEVMHPGRQAGEDLAMRLRGPAGLQLPHHHLHAQRLAQLRVVPAHGSDSMQQ